MHAGTFGNFLANANTEVMKIHAHTTVSTAIQTNKEANDILNVSVKYTIKVNNITRQKHDAIYRLIVAVMSAFQDLMSSCVQHNNQCFFQGL